MNDPGFRVAGLHLVTFGHEQPHNNCITGSTHADGSLCGTARAEAPEIVA